jgi:hypothetical protein
LTAREKEHRVLRLSSFFWTLDDADRSRLRRTLRELLDRDDTVAEFYLERPDVSNRPGAYGV